MSYQHCLQETLSTLVHGIDLGLWWGFWLVSVLATTVGIIVAGGFAIKYNKWFFVAAAAIAEAVSIIMWSARACQLGWFASSDPVNGFWYFDPFVPFLILVLVLVFVLIPLLSGGY